MFFGPQMNVHAADDELTTIVIDIGCLKFSIEIQVEHISEKHCESWTTRVTPQNRVMRKHDRNRPFITGFTTAVSNINPKKAAKNQNRTTHGLYRPTKNYIHNQYFNEEIRSLQEEEELKPIEFLFWFLHGVEHLDLSSRRARVLYTSFKNCFWNYKHKPIQRANARTWSSI